LGIWADKLASAIDLGAGALMGRSSLTGCAFEADTASTLGPMPLLKAEVIARAFICHTGVRAAHTIFTFDADVTIAQAYVHPWWCRLFMTTAGI
jgi:hypothetical protein